MTPKVTIGLERLLNEKKYQKLVQGKFAYLCHAPSVDRNLRLGVNGIRKVFGKRLTALLSPQHGLFGDVQANMIESQDFVHPAFDLKVFSLYSQTRIPTDHMLDGIDTILVDLQDVGTRVYTYIHTMTLLMEKCAAKGIKVIILDRPNPIGGKQIEGEVLNPSFATFVGRHPVPMRHGLTMGEMARLCAENFGSACNFEVVPMRGWKRSMYWEETGLPWVLPSPNIPTVDTAVTYVGTVVLEGTLLSEGRGTTHPLEIIAHPAFEPFSQVDEFQRILKRDGIRGCRLRPMCFIPTFDKHQGKSVGGFQIHVNDRKAFRPWLCVNVLVREFIKRLGAEFKWRPPPYEYEERLLPFDILNGSERVRLWAEQYGKVDELRQIEHEGQRKYQSLAEKAYLYK
ncbi:MAG: DUF1343 domain-containing protein [Oligoflexia bacterium]|nr:DUF1343 domain-containing protein [Oligoflexia bacterium]